MNWTNIDFPRNITPTIRIDCLTAEGLFVVKYLGPGGTYNTIKWHPFKTEENYNAYTARILNAVKKGLSL